MPHSYVRAISRIGFRRKEKKTKITNTGLEANRVSMPQKKLANLKRNIWNEVFLGKEQNIATTTTKIAHDRWNLSEVCCSQFSICQRRSVLQGKWGKCSAHSKLSDMAGIDAYYALRYTYDKPHSPSLYLSVYTFNWLRLSALRDNQIRVDVIRDFLGEKWRFHFHWVLNNFSITIATPSI